MKLFYRDSGDEVKIGDSFSHDGKSGVVCQIVEGVRGSPEGLVVVDYGNIKLPIDTWTFGAWWK